MWCVHDLSEEYIERMECLLRLYARPYCASQPVVCLDEKPVQLHDDKRRCRVARDGTRRRDYEYCRRGIANLFVSVEPLAGKHIVKATKTRDRFEFARVVRDLADRYRGAQKIHLVVDNLSTHSKKALIDTFGRDEAERLWARFSFHYTPKHGSWLNQAEIEISLVSRECLGKRRLGSLAVLGAETRAWAKAANRAKRTISWKFRARHARKKFAYRTSAQIDCRYRSE